MDPIGLAVLSLSVLLAAAFGMHRRRTDGRLIVVGAGSPPASSFRAAPATLLQFSGEFCAPCRPTRTLLASVAAERGLTHRDLDVAEHPDCVRRYGVTRTPTVLVLDAAGEVRYRATGTPSRPALLAALDGLPAHAPAAPPTTRLE